MIALRMAKRVGIAVAGGVLLGAGLVMMVTPGPGLLVMAAGLAVLATEFAWAERQRDRLVTRAKHERERLKRTRKRR
jgi:Putative transmembrane protein (PGPGW).